MRLPGFGFLALLPLALADAARPHLEAGICPQSFINTAVARVVELGGSTAKITTQYNAKALVSSPESYVLALAGKNQEVPAFYEIQVAGKPAQGVMIDTLDE